LHEIATCYFAIGNYAESRTHYLEAVSLRQTPWDLTDSDLFSVLQGLSSCCYLRTDCSSEVALSEALYYARQALDVARNARGCDLQVVLHRVAKYLCLQGHNGEAIPFLLEGLALEQRVPGDNISNCISYLVMIADCYYQETNYDQALNFYLQLRAAIEQAEIPNITDMTDCLNGLGDCHYARGDYQNALDVYNQAFVLALQEGDTEIVEELRSKISTTQAELEHLI
jgi:tetratricopeptide (TPR) repeat protein